ncbi:hypothetical protein PFLG_02824 [Plasmodium falciparum RAJ116]|uniref:Uncharacterized protein n=2 Tax=Plasmodium falciparum TaxID=5833 RepID=A0A0L0D0B1_PLAFA|nr:hypothetical protein PFLG_02824 [Plasmodium falciparum RAJ116]
MDKKNKKNPTNNTLNNVDNMNTSVTTNKDKNVGNHDDKKIIKNKNKPDENVNNNTQTLKKYSYVDIMDSCKKLTNVDTPECIEKLMSENVSLFRKHDDKFCWKLNVC